ncbi:hypothetical protein RND71_014158 [Anisodus tanguticus]|uniref:Histone deacetylase domain-containing protein n=1 Tax=Anisodus tanguticus TaxID=243964 RepID=A0AAE1VDX7_9SOLA|nr:hypothetical protein RND71_014158 [Anisodus tanguticus]
MSTASSSSKTDDAEALRRHRILSSQLYFDVPPIKVPLINSSSYDIAFLGIEKLQTAKVLSARAQFFVPHGFDPLGFNPKGASIVGGLICPMIILKDASFNPQQLVGYYPPPWRFTPLSSIYRFHARALKERQTGPKSPGRLERGTRKVQGGKTVRPKRLGQDRTIPWRFGLGHFMDSVACMYQFIQHPFDSSKWGRICRFLTKEGIMDQKHVVEPVEATKDDLLVVHSESYLKSLNSSLNVSMIVEVPPVAMLPNCLVQKKVLHPFRKQVGGTILAAKLAKERGWAINIGGGFHHCTPHGNSCLMCDCTLEGNGHEMDFSEDRRVFILDMYNPGIYPLDFEARRYIDLGVEVKSGTATDEYLNKLDHALEVAEKKFDPELVIYNAGTDILDGDPLGRLKISPDGIASRDEKVFRFARERNIPLIMLTSGGYMKSSAKVIADSIINLSNKSLIDMKSLPTGKT